MHESTECGSELHIWCQEQNKCSNTVFRLMTPFPEQTLLPALCPLLANLWQLHVQPTPLEGARGRENRKVWCFYSDLASWVCTLLAGGQWGEETKEKEAVLLDQIRASHALSVSFARPTGSSQLTEFPINNKKWNHSNSKNSENTKQKA